MPHQIPYSSYRRHKSGRDIMLLILAIAIVALFWNFIGVLFRVLIFAVVVYFVYRILQSYL